MVNVEMMKMTPHNWQKLRSVRMGPSDFRMEERNVGSLNARKMELLEDEHNHYHSTKKQYAR